MTRAPHNTAGRLLVKRQRGPFGKTYSCPFCAFRVSLKRPEYSLAAFGGAVSKVAAHIAHEHADKMNA